MQAIAWWAIPAVATLLAVVWVSIANRPRPPADPTDSVAEHERFQEAMRRTLARSHRDGGLGSVPPPPPDGDT